MARFENVRRGQDSMVHFVFHYPRSDIETVRDIRICYPSDGTCSTGPLPLCKCVRQGRGMYCSNMVQLHHFFSYDRDMANEKFGFMLIFWNMAGVPFTYGHATLFLANHPPSAYRWPISYNIAVYALLLGAYYIWDTANSQKNRFRQQMNGAPILRKAFPQLPWGTVNNPKILRTKAGPLLADGWCMSPNSVQR